MRKIREEHHSKYLKSKRIKDAIPEKPIKKTPISVTPVTQEDNFRLITPPNKWPEGAICITGDSILNGIGGSLLSQKRLVKVRQFPGATITEMYDRLKPIFQSRVRHLNEHGTSRLATNYIAAVRKL